MAPATPTPTRTPPAATTTPTPTAESLNVIALISGGKDSLFSILHCIANGHVVVALANVYPSSPPPPPRPLVVGSSSARKGGGGAGGEGGQNAIEEDAKEQEEQEEQEVEVDVKGEDMDVKDVDVDVNVEDMDSYMYQTVGHTIVGLYEQALQIPLYRQEMSGTAVNVDRSYHYHQTHHHHLPPSGDAGGDALPLSSGKDTGGADETESLIPLLQRVKRAHPAANAISTGAILSDYQRTRVESVAGRLGLTPLSFLWQYPALPPPPPPPPPRSSSTLSSASSSSAALLEDMGAVGQDARIIKVASGGLDESFLWENVASERGRSRLSKAMGRFGAGEGAVLGEGGEFETLAVDGPVELWHQRIEIAEADKVLVRGGGGCAWLNFRGARLVPKAKSDGGGGDMGIRGSSGGAGSIANLRIPDILDQVFLKISEMPLDPRDHDHGESLNSSPSPSRSTSPWDASLPDLLSTTMDNTWFISNLSAPVPEDGDDVAEQMAAIAAQIQSMLTSARRSTDDIVFTTILLRSITSFAQVNEIYASLFTRPNPPARLTVGLGGDCLPRGIHLMLSIVVDLGPRPSRNGLHVQSRSYWAPANIGPYSQAISVPQGTRAAASVVYVAGQIPLVPASMRMPVDAETGADGRDLTSFQYRAVLALQHLWRIGRVMKVDWWAGGVAFITGDGDDIRRKAVIASEVWTKRHSIATHTDGDNDKEQEEEDDDGTDIWDRRYGGTNRPLASHDPAHDIPNLDMVIRPPTSSNSPTPPPFFAVQVHELPRGADIEWSSLGSAHGRILVHDAVTADDELTIQSCCCCCIAADLPSRAVILHASIADGCTDDQAQARFQEIVNVEVPVSLVGSHGEVVRTSKVRVGQMTIYTSRSGAVPPEWRDSVIQCRSVWGAAGKRLAAGVVVRGEATE
ncbi:MAG: hypothetical protein M1837_001252 [Sclerophora amabilis]|nr:MAG: hypothetical protein M1837_001252 [Sclerophora amabilis]